MRGRLQLFEYLCQGQHINDALRNEESHCAVILKERVHCTTFHAEREEGPSHIINELVFISRHRSAVKRWSTIKSDTYGTDTAACQTRHPMKLPAQIPSSISDSCQLVRFPVAQSCISMRAVIINFRNI